MGSFVTEAIVGAHQPLQDDGVYNAHIKLVTIAVIYNAFNISVLERISEFGLLRSVGATPSQIRGIVLKEALILSLIAIPLGLFAGVFSMEITISWGVFTVTTIISFMTVMLSAIGPTIRAGKVSPLEAIRKTGDLNSNPFKKIKMVD